MTVNELHEVILSHAQWRKDPAKGKRADFTGADLTRAVLRDANLTDAVLTGADLTDAVLRGTVFRGAVLRGTVLTGALLTDADLSGADLSGADLTGADLTDADLTGAVLRGTVLTGAVLRGTVLTGAVLRGTVLTGANLTDADLTRAVLTGANLAGADLTGAVLRDAKFTGAVLTGANLQCTIGFDLKEIERRRICPDGAFTAWKKLSDGTICQLLILADAERVGGLTERKCRASYAQVIAGSGQSRYNGGFSYAPGIVRAAHWNSNPFVVCGGGIHFYITRLEAEEHK